MKIIPTTDGQFQIADDGDHFVAGPFGTQAEAWRYHDRLISDPISPAEQRADYGAMKFLSSGPAPIIPMELKPAKKLTKKQRRLVKAAAKAPRWLRDIAAAKFDPHGKRKYRDSRLGTFGAASAVRKIDPATGEAVQ